MKYFKKLMSEEDGEPCTETWAGLVGLVCVVTMVILHLTGTQINLPIFNGMLTFTAACLGIKWHGRITMKKKREYETRNN